MTTVTEPVPAGGKPNEGTPKDKRLRENAPKAKKPETAAADDGDITRGTPFTVLLVVEGLESSDGRLLELGTTTWREMPMPLMMRDTDTHGSGEPAPTWPAGQIVEVFRDPEDESRIMGRGFLMPGESGGRAEEIIRHAFRSVSIDGFAESVVPPERQPTHVDQNETPLKVLTRFNDVYIDSLTVVRSPAFRACCIWFDDETQPDYAAAAHGGFIDPERAPEVVEVPEPDETDLLRLLLASGGGPLNPPKDWFLAPEPDHRQEIVVHADGSLTGHAVGKGECHVANNLYCDTAPQSKTTPPFLGFHRTEVECDDGSRLACGWIAIDTNHGAISGGRRDAEGWSQEQTWDHYEHSGTLIAKVRASNGKHGIWLSGCLLPGLSERALAISQGLSVSGHWNVFTDPRSGQTYPDELLAVLGGVPFPGYPETRTRPELLVASGADGRPQVLAHVGVLPCEEECVDCDEPAPEASAVDLALFGLAARAGLTADEVLALPATDDGFAALFAALDDVAAADMVTCPNCGAEVPMGTETCPECGAAMAVADDLTVPLSTAERATWFARYDADARAVAAAVGRALPDGSMVIEDADDLRLAIRAGAPPKHLARNAERLGLGDLLQR